MLVRKLVMKGLAAALVAMCICLPCFTQQNDGASLAAFDRALAQGQVEKARQLLGEILARPHVQQDILLQAGVALAQRELFAPAAEVFARCVKDYPRSFEAHYNLALADIALQRFDEARAALDSVNQPSKHQQYAREYLRGKIYDALGQTDLAARSLSAAFAGAPEEENYALDLGLFYLRRRLYAKAVATLEAGVKYHPNSVFLSLGLALSQVFGDEPPKAVATCRKILAMEPDFGPAQILMVVAFYMNGENENCVRETAAAIGRPNAAPYLYYLHAAALLKLDSREYQSMLHDLESANRGIPGCTFCYFTASKVHQAMGDESAAIADLETLVTRVDPEFAQGWYRLANLYQHARRTTDAAQALAKFRAIRTAQNDRETEYLRKLFLSALGAKAPESATPR